MISESGLERRRGRSVKARKPKTIKTPTPRIMGRRFLNGEGEMGRGEGVAGGGGGAATGGSADTGGCSIVSAGGLGSWREGEIAELRGVAVYCLVGSGNLAISINMILYTHLTRSSI